MNLPISIVILIIWVFTHSLISINYLWKTSIASLTVYFAFVLIFYKHLPMSVMFLFSLILLTLMTISCYSQRDKFKDKIGM